jgi:acetylornithine aminotransferase
MEEEALMQRAAESGRYLVDQLGAIAGVQNVRGQGLMIGFDVAEPFKDLRKNLLSQHHIFTGEAKPAAVRLLPALSVARADLDEALSALRCELYDAGKEQASGAPAAVSSL